MFLLNIFRSWRPCCRWDYWRWHVSENIFRFNLSSVLWRRRCRLAPCSIEGPGEAFWVHPLPLWQAQVEMMAMAKCSHHAARRGRRLVV